MLDRSQGRYDKALFLEYLKLPRRPAITCPWVKTEQEGIASLPGRPERRLHGVTLLPLIGTTSRWCAATSSTSSPTADSPKEFEPYINDVYLRHLFAETKIDDGLGEPEQWASQLPPELFRQFKERVDIDFAFTNKTDFARRRAGEARPVRQERADADREGVRDQHAELSTATHQQEVDTDVNLDGLVANAETVAHVHAEPPLRRVAKQFEFPQLTQAGRVRDRLHRRRQEQPGAGPQGPAAAAGRRPAPPGRSFTSSTTPTSR